MVLQVMPARYQLLAALDDPDGVDLVPPGSLTITPASAMGEP